MARRPVRDDRDEDDAETPPWMERAPKPARAYTQAEPTQTLISWRALIIGGVIALIAAIGLVIGVRRMSTPDSATVAANGDVPLIRAPATPYKTRVGGDASAPSSTDPTQAADPIGALASAEADPNAAPTAVAPVPAPAPAPAQAPAPRDLLPGTAPANSPVDATADAPDLVPDEPAPRAAPAPRKPVIPATNAAKPPKPFAEPAVAAKAKPKLKAPPPETTAPSANELTAEQPAKPRTREAVQLGAFSTRAKAEAAWASATAAHGELAGLQRSIEPIERDGHTLYRLRATGAGALTPARCAALKAAGAVCVGKP